MRKRIQCQETSGGNKAGSKWISHIFRDQTRGNMTSEKVVKGLDVNLLNMQFFIILDTLLVNIQSVITFQRS